MKIYPSKKKILTVLAMFAMVPAVVPAHLGGSLLGAAASPAQNQPPAQEQPQPARLSPEQLQQIVAPIALYPDALVAQILAASAYPTQIVEAQRFMQQNPNLKGADLGAQVDKQDWDPSVKALTQFPSVLADMDKNLSWTSTLGDANMNQQADVMDAVQFMRKKAQDAGSLKTTPQQTVTSQGTNVVIQPANPQVVYVPDYDPELVYGYPVPLWPGFYPWWGGGPYLSFGIGFGIGPFFGFGWGWHAWGFDWGRRGLLFGGGPYGFHSHAFYDRNAYMHGNFRGYSDFGRGDRGLRGYGGAGAGGRSVAPSGRSGAFGGVGHGGDARGFSSRGQSSMGGRSFGGGGFHGGGGGRGGGGHR
ncbi:MAG: DUF3300 domain-containing protein [Candidatus Acidiferrales bacterium]|jgi:uncharacterized membrane protein YgcG